MRLHALKLAPQGINVNCLIPGFTKTEAWSHVSGACFYEGWLT